ncbi:TonB-dependent receptor plug domain-containing protein [Alteraurantiacibacter buctensis]|uniref:Outer membrane beta-barrel protein n=1 Tax=Alteraurantiacibacter buctensis TaxID=1503981 RepID=A0A844YWP6_9SPHN|nr:outer membrane beta-barrel protein [Alteraurantiacibacter buctensis]MXO71562.1 outer membrane beta-barrel protein [Alteraurantiacibacter buctensis]
MLRSRFLLTAATAALASAIALPAAAQDQAPAGTADETQVQDASTIVVLSGIGYRNRSEDAVPELVYDEQFFQRFEPLTAGDALRRVPSVTFLSDVIESDGARLRGLDPGYTQILINGDRVPGSNADRSFFLDRVPAELIERVEIVRSSTARRTGDAVAGTINIELRDGLSLDGGYMRAGGLYFNDGEIKPSVGVYFGGEMGPGRVLAGFNVQGRYNPKQKTSLRFGDSPENNPDFFADDFDNREDQTDTRDGIDYAGNVSYVIDADTTRFELAGNFVRTDRTETERSFEYNSPTAISGPVRTTPPGNLLTDNDNVNDISQTSFSLESELEQEWALGETKLRAAFSRFTDDQFEYEYEIDFDRTAPRFTGDLTQVDIVDEEMSLQLEHIFKLADDLDLAIGGFAQNKDRDTDIGEIRSRFNLPAAMRTGYNQFSQTPLDFVGTFAPFAAPAGGLNTIEEDRRDLFALIEGESGALSFEAGIRWENTDVTIEDLTVAAAQRVQTNSYDYILPSASAKISVGDGRFTLSAARTMRRPRLDYISPALLEAELGDNDLLGNPQLAPETAWGGDVGYEHRLGRTGVAGINFFYRAVQNLVEVANTGVEGSEGAGTFVLQPRNTGDGKVWGVEFDLSTSLGFLGLPDTGVFGNLGYVDSEITDVFGTRRFNGQSEYVYNVGLIQDFPSLGAALGVNYRKQGAAFDRTVGEEVTTTYGADLEVFVEKRFGDSFTVRLVGSNLLDSSKDEVFNKFTTIEDQQDRSFDEYELETEEAGPVFQLIARYAF